LVAVSATAVAVAGGLLLGIRLRYNWLLVNRC